MAQRYTVRELEKSDFQDMHGNYWCTANLEGVSEPVKWVLKDPTKIEIGQSYYGEIKDATSKAGKPYLRFYKQQPPEDGQAGGSSSSSTSTWKDNSDGQRQGMCINNAAAFITAQNAANPMTAVQWADLVHEFAAALYAKGNLVTQEQATVVPQPDNSQSLSAQYRQKRADAGTETLDQVFPVHEEPINLDDIPF
jgi:hypothetical protein